MIIYTIFLNVISLSRLANASKWMETKIRKFPSEAQKKKSLTITEQEEEKHYLNF